MSRENKHMARKVYEQGKLFLSARGSALSKFYILKEKKMYACFTFPFLLHNLFLKNIKKLLIVLQLKHVQ